MTGRDIIIFIMENRLENVDIFKEPLPGYITAEEFAERMDVGLATIDVWLKTGKITCIQLESGCYIQESYEKILKEAKNEEVSKKFYGSDGWR